MSEEVETTKQSFSIIQKAIVVLLALILIIVALVGVYFLAENYFFDKFFYQKSMAHGYYQFWPNELEDWQIVAENYNENQRNTDLLNLISAELGDQQAIANLAEERVNSNIKIAIIGDSMFFGTGVRKNQTITNFLDQILSKNYQVRVFNYSFAGDDILDNYLKYQLVKKHLDPDIVVLGLVTNDLVFDNFDRYPGKQELYQKLIESCDERELVEWKIEDRKNNDFDVDNLVFYPSFEENSQNYCFLNLLAQDFKENNIVVSYFDCPDHSCNENSTSNICSRSWVFNQYSSAFVNSLPRIDYCDLQIGLISNQEKHHNASTNKKFAEKLAKFLIEKYAMFQ